MGRFLYAILWTMLSATKGHYVSAIVGQNPSAQALGIRGFVIFERYREGTVTMN